MSVKIDPEGPRRSKKDPVRLRKLRQTSQAAFAATSFSSWFSKILIEIDIIVYLIKLRNYSVQNSLTYFLVVEINDRPWIVENLRNFEIGSMASFIPRSLY